MPTDGNSPSEIDPHFDPPSVKEVKALRAALEEARKERDGWKDGAERHHEDAKGLMRYRESLEIQLERAW